jgi:hypothetical protein
MTRTSANRARTHHPIARHFLRATGGSAAALATGKATFPGGVAHVSGPEVRGAELGFIALTDAAALFVAAQKSVLPGAGLPWPEKRLDTAYLMYRRRVPAFLCARHRPPQPLAAE